MTGNPLRHRNLVLALVARDLKVRYRRSLIGFLWTMLEPPQTTLVSGGQVDGVDARAAPT